MKSWKAVVAALFVAVAAGVLGMQFLKSSVVHSKSKHIHGNASYVMHAIRDYRTAHGSYPLGSGTGALAGSLEPRAVEMAQSWKCRYVSDGKSYILIFPNVTAEQFIYVDDKLVGFPSSLRGEPDIEGER